MEDLEAEAIKVRRRTEDPDKLMAQLKLIQKKQEQLMEQQRLLQVRFIAGLGLLLVCICIVTNYIYSRDRYGPLGIHW